jgi:Tfp pilus assembly protein PilV
MTSTTTNLRPGISLLEVLISIGILSIGLLSVLALLPAGRTYLVKAEIDDRAATIIPNAISTMEALGLFASDSLDWIPRTATTVTDAERPAERPMFKPQEVLVQLPRNMITRNQIDEKRWDTTNIGTAIIKTRHPTDSETVTLSGVTPQPNASVRVFSTGTAPDMITSGSNGTWTFSRLLPGSTNSMQIHESGPSVGQVVATPPHWTDVTFTVECETTSPTGQPIWEATPFTITPAPNRSDPTNIPSPGYRLFGQRRSKDARTGKASITLDVTPMDRVNNTPDQAQSIAPPKLLDIVENGKIRMIRRAFLPYEGEVWRLQTGTWKADYRAEFSFANNEAQTVTSRSYEYPTFWSTPEKDPPGTRLRIVPTVVGATSRPFEEDVDYVTFPVSAGDGFQLDWSNSPSRTNLANLADPSDGVGEPFAVEFQRNGGSWLPLDPFDAISHNYSVPNDGKVRLGVGLKAYTGLPSGGPANTIGYDQPTALSVEPYNTEYKLNVSIFRPDRMVAIDPLMCAHLDRVIFRSGLTDLLQHPLAARRLRFAQFEQWFMGSRANARAFVIPRLNWRVVADIPDFDSAIAFAERICRVEDSVAANTPVDGDAANEPGFDVSADGLPLRRQAAGRMTWMLTVQPEDLGSVEANWHPGRSFNASIVVFQDRQFPEIGATSLEGEYAFEAGWSDDDGLIRIYVPNSTGVAGSQPAMEDEDLKRLLGAGSWMLLGPRVTYTSSPVDSQMRLEWIKIQSSQIERQKDQIIVTVLPEKEPGDNVLLRGNADPRTFPDRYITDNGVQRLRIMVLAYQGVVAVVQRSITVRP